MRTNVVSPACVCTPISLTNASQNVLCNGGTSGSVNLSPSGGNGQYAFNWSSSSTSEDLSGLATGTYTVTVTEGNGCTAVNSATITQPAVLSIAATAGAAACPASTTGTVSTTTSGGRLNYTYSWNNGSTASSLSLVGPGTYTVTVTDANLCTATSSATITALLSSTPPTLAAPSITCPNTTVNLTATGGTAGTGSVINWYSGPNGTGTLLGTGSSLPFVPNATSTTVYARRVGTCNITADASVVVNSRYYVYALNGTSTTTYCTDTSGWNHFYVGNEIILSIQGNLTTAGTVTATIRDNGQYYSNTGIPALCASGITPGEAQFEMERNWNVQYTGTLSGTYNLRYYFEPRERNTVINAANNWISTYAACGYTYKYPNPSGWIWFKNQGSPYTAPDYDDDPSFLMLSSSGTGTTFNAINWSTMGNLTNFSGGTGAVILIPSNLLPVEWLYFNGTAMGVVNKLNWATAKEENSAIFEIQRSNDAVNFEKIGELAASGNSSELRTMSFLMPIQLSDRIITV